MQELVTHVRSQKAGGIRQSAKGSHFGEFGKHLQVRPLDVVAGDSVHGGRGQTELSIGA